MFRFSPPVTLRLEQGELLTWRHGLKAGVRVRSGLVHLTRQGDSRDYFLRPGQTMDLRGSRWLVISAEQPAVVSFEAAPGWRGWAALSGELRRWAGRGVCAPAVTW